MERIEVREEDEERMKGEMNEIMGFVEKLNEVDVEGIEKMKYVKKMKMSMSEEKVKEGGIEEEVVENEKVKEENLLVVKKVVE